VGLIETGPLVGYRITRDAGNEEQTLRAAWLFVIQCLATGDREKAWLALKWQPDKSKPETLADLMAQGALELLEELRAEFAKPEPPKAQEPHFGGLAAAAASASQTSMGPSGYRPPANPSPPKPPPPLTPHQVWIRDHPGEPWPEIMRAPLEVLCRVCLMKGLKRPVKACKVCRGEGDSHQDELHRAKEQQAALDAKRGGWPFPCTPAHGREFCGSVQRHSCTAYQPRHGVEKPGPACELCREICESNKANPDAPRVVKKSSKSSRMAHQSCLAKALDWIGRDEQDAKVEDKLERFAIQKEAKEAEASGGTAARPEGKAYGQDPVELKRVHELLGGEPAGGDW